MLELPTLDVLDPVHPAAVQVEGLLQLIEAVGGSKSFLHWPTTLVRHG